jgi:hypothetical protein
MANTLYFDNDADLYVKKVPAESVVQYAITTMGNADSYPVIPVNGALSGTMTYNALRRRFEAVIDGDDIRQYLTPTNHGNNTHHYAVVYWWGQNLRKVIPDVVVNVRRT